MNEEETKVEGEEVVETPTPEMNEVPLTPEEEAAKKAMEEGKELEII
jgi:hypothetical protein